MLTLEMVRQFLNMLQPRRIHIMRISVMLKLTMKKTSNEMSFSCTALLKRHVNVSLRKDDTFAMQPFQQIFLESPSIFVLKA